MPHRSFFRVLGVPIHVVSMSQVVEQMEDWIVRTEGHRVVAVTNVHVIMEALHDPSFKKAVEESDLVVPDGMPLVWLGRLQGHSIPHRIYGPDLLLAFCERTSRRKYTHFFYGGARGVADEMVAHLKNRLGDLRVVGTYSPPFRSLTPEEDIEVIRMINQAAPSVLWVGLGCPKQERWIHDHRSRLNVPLMLGVGQAFDLISGRTRQVPRFMGDHGFEWLFRLCREPRRLWRRYLIYNTQFLYSILLEKLSFNLSRRKEVP
jgi:N-acetylglucosaminyldiphosphoundecaprenol N-acetyl-beta-D-mannosaminyltransferase